VQPAGAYWLSLVVLASLTVVVLGFLAGSLTAMVDFATIVAFLTAPVLGYLNLRAVTAPHVPLACRPGPLLRLLSWVGLGLLSGTALLYLGYWGRTIATS
jgi:Mn2+/Fe2+ NRAMP family transporter